MPQAYAYQRPVVDSDFFGHRERSPLWGGRVISAVRPQEGGC